MQLDISKIDHRINKLQEIRRIASDPEMVKILLEFLTPDQEEQQHGPEQRKAIETSGNRDSPRTGDLDEANDIIEKALGSTGSQPSRSSDSYAVWNKKKT